MNFGWICKLTSMCIKMASTRWNMTCVVSKSISKLRWQSWKKFGGDWTWTEEAYLPGKLTFDATKKLKMFHFWKIFRFSWILNGVVSWRLCALKWLVIIHMWHVWYQKASPNIWGEAGKSLGVIGHELRKLTRQENWLLTQRKIWKFSIFEKFSDFHEFWMDL